MKFYVYEYRNPLTKIPFYVGKGYGNRLYDHLKGYSHNQGLMDYIESLKLSGLEPEIEKVFESDSEDCVLGVEEHLIKSYGLKSKGGVLENLLSSGGKNSYYDLPKDCLELLGEVTDLELSKRFNIPETTIKHKRRALDIKSFRETRTGTEEFSDLFRKDHTVHTLYNSNGGSVTGTRKQLEEIIGIKTSDLGELASGKSKRWSEWYYTKDLADTVNDIYKLYKFFNKDTEEIKVCTYPDLAEYTGYLKRSVRNLATGHRKTCFEWVIIL